MLRLYLNRPEERNRRKHPSPTPTVTFARTYLQTVLIEKEATIIDHVINYGTHWHKEGQEIRHIFDHDDHDSPDNAPDALGVANLDDQKKLLSRKLMDWLLLNQSTDSEEDEYNFGE